MLVPRIRQVMFDEFAETHTFVQPTNQNQSTIDSDLRPLEIDLYQGVESELTRMVCFSPTECQPPESLHRVRTRINSEDVEHHCV